MERWRFVDPMSPTLVQTTIAFADEIPDLDTARLADLLQIGLPHAEALADRAVLNAPVTIRRSVR